MSKLDKLIKQEIDNILEEGFADRAEAVFRGVPDVHESGASNKDILRAQSILKRFLKKARALEQETEEDLNILKLDKSSSWIKDIFDRYSKIHEVMDHIKQVVDASPEEVREGRLQSSAEAVEAPANKGEEQIQKIKIAAAMNTITKKFQAMQLLQKKLSGLYDDLYNIHEELVGTSDRGADDFESGLLQRYKKILDEISIVEYDYDSISSKTVEQLAANEKELAV